MLIQQLTVPLPPQGAALAQQLSRLETALAARATHAEALPETQQLLHDCRRACATGARHSN
ncbi:hypothetical protein HC891_02785 [Candidatus Gracilibacteria bacterium]|nr:hypothetical protein [Candidatus Gracilibacteria bacterium]